MEPRKSGDIFVETSLSGEWISLREALTWAKTRNVAMSVLASQESAIKLALETAFWLVENGGRDARWLDGEEAKEELLRLLRHGKVEARGGSQARPSEGQRSMSSADWTGLEFHNIDDEAVARPKRYEGDDGWIALQFNAEDVLKHLPRTQATRAEQAEIDREEAERRFDPMAEIRWSLPMALAWIATQEAADVRRVWDDFRKAVGEPPADLEDLAPIELEARQTAWRELRSAAEAGTIIVRGVDQRSNGSAEIGPALWRSMTPASGAGGLRCVPAGADFAFLDVTVSSEATRKLWAGYEEVTGNDEEEESPEIAQNRAIAAAAFRKRLTAMFDAYQADGSKPYGVDPSRVLLRLPTYEPMTFGDEASAAAAPVAAPPQRATNPKTGQTIELRNGQWVPAQ